MKAIQSEGRHDTLTLEDEHPAPTGAEGLSIDHAVLGRFHNAVVAAMVLGLVSALALAWHPWSQSDPAAAAEAWAASQRDAATVAATQGLLALNTIDYRHAGPVVDHWATLADGALARDIASSRAAVIRRAQQNRTSARATLVQAAVSAFDAQAGTATVIAVLAITASKGQAATTTTQRSRFRVLVQRKDDRWKLTYFEALASPR